ncbi:hypothetical protein GCM10020001_054470 [Nonomuraea salmonea]
MPLAGGIYGALLGMAMSDQAPENQIRLEVGPALGEVELNELFGASWPDYRPASFSGMLACSLCWVAAYREAFHPPSGWVWAGAGHRRASRQHAMHGGMPEQSVSEARSGAGIRQPTV